MEKIRLWFVYEKVVDKNGKFSKTTWEVIRIINKLEKFYDKNILDLRAVEYERFILEHKNIAVGKKDLPVTLLNKKIFFIKELPSVSKLKKEIKELLK